jgi:hypothetical protein
MAKVIFTKTLCLFVCMVGCVLKRAFLLFVNSAWVPPMVSSFPLVAFTNPDIDNLVESWVVSFSMRHLFGSTNPDRERGGVLQGWSVSFVITHLFRSFNLDREPGIEPPDVV